jgi:hypothetical protein
VRNFGSRGIEKGNSGKEKSENEVKKVRGKERNKERQRKYEEQRTR